MGEPYCKDLLDPEKGQPHQSMGEGITNMFSKAGEGITNAFTKAGEGIHATGATLKDSAKSAGAMVGLGASTGQKTPQNQKSNPKRARQEKKFRKGYKPVPREEPKDTNIVGNITKLLPANTFLMFQTLAPLATNDGNCGQTERIMTGAVLMILCSTCMMVCFTDTIQFNGKVYHGLVTRSGLWNPSFKGDPSFADLRQYEVQLAEFYEARRRYKVHKRNARKAGLPLPVRPEEPTKPRGPHVMGSTYTSGNSQYQLNFTDLLHAVLSAMAFGTLTMLTNPVSTCFYPNIPSTVVKTLPLLVGFVISAIFAFSPPARNGIAHPLSPKVPSLMDNYKPPDPKGVVHGPSLPPKPPGEGDRGGAAAAPGGKPKPDDDDDDDGGSVKRFIGKLFSSSPEHHDHTGPKPNPPPDHHQGLDSMKAFASGIFSRYGHDVKQGASKVMQGLEDDVKREASQLLLKAAPGVAELRKDIHVPLALQEAARTVPHEALVAGLVNAGAHPALALAAVQSAVHGARDAVFNQMQQELQAVTSGPLAGLAKQTSFDLTRANSMLQSAGSSLSLPSAQDARDGLFHQAASVLQRQLSGLSPTLHPPGPEAAAIALATGQALMQAGFQFPGNGLSLKAAELDAFSQGMGTLNLSAANALLNDAATLAQQGGKSVTELQDELARQQAAFAQGLNSHMHTLYSPAQSLASLATFGSQTLNQFQDQAAQGTLAAALAGGAARQAGTLLQVGADHGIAEVQDEIARQSKAAIALQASSMAQDAASVAQLGSQTFSNAKADLLKQTEVLTQEMNTQVRDLSAPAASMAQDIAALVTQSGPQPTVSAINAQFAESLARGVARGVSTRIQADQVLADHGAAMAQLLQQPATTVAIDVASLIQMQAQLARQASGLSLEALHAGAQMQAMLGQFQQSTPQQALGTHAALRNLATNAGLVIEDVTDAATAAQRAGDRIQRTASQLPSVRVEAMAALPSTSQVRAAANEIAASASDAAGQAALATVTRILRSDRPESTEITDSISTEEITSESETELINRGGSEFQTNPSSSSSRSRSFGLQQQGSGK